MSSSSKPTPSKRQTLRKFLTGGRKSNTNATETNNNTSLEKGLANMKINNEKEKKKETKVKKEKEIENQNSFETIVLKANGLTFTADKVVGSGSFGVVVRAVIQETNEVCAIKKVLQDKRYKNRELQIMQMVNHCNVVKLISSFYTNGDKPDEVFLNLVLEFIPDTVYRVSRQYSKTKQPFPIIYSKLFTYQLLRALNYIHSLGICHRDIKPQNLLLNPETGVLKLCDFGSAKILVQGETNVSYICSRYYRAPELIFGSTTYTTSIDVWSTGCVLAELLLGQPLFPGESGVDQLVEIIKILGTPTKEQIQQMNQNYTIVKPFPQIKGHPWSKIFRNTRSPPEAVDLVQKLLQYIPSSRLHPLEALAHPFFDELREPTTVLPNGNPLPPLFDFSPEELKPAPHLAEKLIPPHFQKT